MNHKRMERIWREEGLKVPKKQPKRKRLWLNDGSCVRLRSNRRNHVWSFRLVADRTSDGLPIRMLTLRGRVHSGVPRDRRCQEADERRCSRAAERPVRLQGCAGSYPQRLSREFTAKSVREWLGRVGVKTLFIEPGSPWEKGYIESFFCIASRRAAGTGSV